MNIRFTRADVKKRVGPKVFKLGWRYFQNGQVSELTYDPNLDCFHARVIGSEVYHVYVGKDESGFLDTTCNCPAYQKYDGDCKHIAAVLLEICEGSGLKLLKQSMLETAAHPEGTPKLKTSEWLKTKTFFSLFQLEDSIQNAQPSTTEKSAFEPERLELEFHVRLQTRPYQKSYLTLEMKMGVKRLYVVQKIKDLLKQIAANKPYFFTKHFTFDPTFHQFKREDKEIIDMLIKIYKNEITYWESMSYYAPSYYSRNDKSLLIPPAAWEQLWPKLKQENVKFICEDNIYEYITVEDKLPFQYVLTKESEDRYILEIQQFDHVFVLEDYGYVVQDGVFYHTDHWQLVKIKELQQHFLESRRHQIQMDAEQMHTFVEKVIPALERIGEMKYIEEVSDQIKKLPLQAKIHVDREDERLTIQLEFHYGETIIRPLLNREQNIRKAEEQVFILRDLEKEVFIVRLIEEAGFKVKGDQIYLKEEALIYHFLYHMLPKFHEVAEVYVTPNVQTVIHEKKQVPNIHIDMNRSNRLLEINFDIEDIDEKEIQHILQTVVEKKKFYRMSDGSFLSLEQDGFKQISNLLEQLGVHKKEIQGQQLQLPAVRALQIDEHIRQTHSLQIGEALQKFLEHMKHPDRTDYEIPAELSDVLRDYQKIGFQWFRTLHEYRFGGILADDMGLGKTLQSIAYILSEKKNPASDGKPALILAPASLVYNWKKECEKFAPSLKTAVITGTKQERVNWIKKMATFDVIVTSYPLIRRDIELYQTHSFRMLILDEAQAIKNAVTQTAQAVKMIQAERRFALTGTPIENKIDELWSIFDAVFPGLFPGKKAFARLSPDQVAKISKPFILRRMKQDVLKELPDKIETVQTTALNKQQKKLYLAYLERIQQEALRHIEEDGFQKSRMKILAGLTRLRQLCCHPATFIENYQGGSSKLDQLFQLLHDCLSSGKRMLIFSQFTSMLAIIKDELERENITYFYLDGKTPSQTRVDMADKFNRGEKQIFLISLKAGGTGLNLTGADTVILYDLWWNPAVEKQATDRAHRIGQKHIVHVIRLITQGTIEEKIYELQQKKKDLIDRVVQPGDASLSSLSEAEIRELLMLRS